MTTRLSPRGKRGALLIGGIVMIASTLRVTFTGAAPSLETIRADYGLSTSHTGLRTTVPLLASAPVLPLAAGIDRRVRRSRSSFAAMLSVFLGISLPSRSFAVLLFSGSDTLWVGTASG